MALDSVHVIWGPMGLNKLEDGQCQRGVGTVVTDLSQGLFAGSLLPSLQYPRYLTYLTLPVDKLKQHLLDTP
jgi:hypothetical protein